MNIPVRIVKENFIYEKGAVFMGDIVNSRLSKIKGEKGIYVAKSGNVEHIVNISNKELAKLDLPTVNEYINLLSQHIIFVQQETNEAKAKEIEAENTFKVNALPIIMAADKIKTKEERWIYAATTSNEMWDLYSEWQNAEIHAALMKEMPERYIEKLNVLKRIQNDLLNQYHKGM